MGPRFFFFQHGTESKVLLVKICDETTLQANHGNQHGLLYQAHGKWFRKAPTANGKRVIAILRLRLLCNQFAPNYVLDCKP